MNVPRMPYPPHLPAVVALAVFLLPAVVHAQALPSPSGLGFNVVETIRNALNIPFGAAATLPAASALDFIVKVLQFILSLLALLALIILIIAGLMYLLSLGDERKTESAKKTILAAIIGLLIVGTSLLILTVIQSFFI